MDKYQCLKLSSFFTKLSKNNMGGGGASDALMPPMLFFSKSKNYLSNQMHSFLPRTKITWGASCAPHHTPPSWQGASDTTHPLSTTHNIPHQHTTHLTTTPPHHHPPHNPTPPPPPTHGEKVGP